MLASYSEELNSKIDKEIDKIDKQMNKLKIHVNNVLQNVSNMIKGLDVIIGTKYDTNVEDQSYDSLIKRSFFLSEELNRVAGELKNREDHLQRKRKEHEQYINKQLS